MTEFQPMPNSPPSDWKFITMQGNVALLWDIDRNERFIKAPVTIGERRAVREEWRLHWVYQPHYGAEFEMRVLYRDGTERVLRVALTDRCEYRVGSWQPADTMPDWAVRRYQRCVSCAPVQACNVTEKQAVAMGYVADDDFTARDRFEWWCDEQFGTKGKHETWGWLITWEDEP